MKAIIMAGGEGTRLRPVSARKPKPMVELLDKPVLAHILALLKRNGITEACLTLRFMPDTIRDYFGDGARFGMRLDYRVETEALGTAGGVKGCADFIGCDDFLIVSGDCVCDFDLQKLVTFHKEKNAEVTLALYSHDEPLEYGLVVTDEADRVTRFVEKPGWERVVTDRINTGIYVMKASILDEIPSDAPYDFGRQLFPRLLNENRALYGISLDGYWCDIGSPDSYRACCMDILRGAVQLPLDVKPLRDGVCCAGSLPEDVTIEPPVYIGHGVKVDPGAVIGPYTVLAAASAVGPGAVVTGSVVCGAQLEEGVSCENAVVCRGTKIGRVTSIKEEAVVGEDCVVGENCRIEASAKIWPAQEIASGASITGCVLDAPATTRMTFIRPGVLEGTLGDTLTAAACVRLGAAAAALGVVGVADDGSDGAHLAADSLDIGVRLTGGDVVRHDGACAAHAALVGRFYNWTVSIFAETVSGSIRLTFFGHSGAALPRELERKLEAAQDASGQLSDRLGRSRTISGVADTHAAEAVRAVGAVRTDYPLDVAVTGSGAENETLRHALGMLGCRVTAGRPGAFRLEALPGGFALVATDEDGHRLSAAQTQAAVALAALSDGAHTLIVPADAPAALDAVAVAFGASLVRADEAAENDGSLAVLPA